MYKAMYKGQPLGGGSSAPAGSNIPSGGIMMWMGPTAPDGWILCDGAELAISEYPALASAIEAQHGTKNFFGGDGTNTFAVPDLRGRFPLGASATHAIGETGGAEEVTLTVNEMPAHTHSYMQASSRNNYVLPGTSTTGLTFLQNTSSSITGVSGNNQPHNNMPPFLVLTFIIKI